MQPCRVIRLDPSGSGMAVAKSGQKRSSLASKQTTYPSPVRGRLVPNEVVKWHVAPRNSEGGIVLAALTVTAACFPSSLREVRERPSP